MDYDVNPTRLWRVFQKPEPRGSWFASYVVPRVNTRSAMTARTVVVLCLALLAGSAEGRLRKAKVRALLADVDTARALDAN